MHQQLDRGRGGEGGGGGRGWWGGDGGIEVSGSRKNAAFSVARKRPKRTSSAGAGGDRVKKASANETNVNN